MRPKSLRRYAWLSIAAALSTILLKGLAWRLTDSVGLLSDAIESFVNLAGALMALGMLSVAARPADHGHAYGHTKAEYFSSAFEGFLIVVAAVWIAIEAVERLLHARPIEAAGIGLGVAAVATIINYATARVLMTVGHQARSIALEADARHLLTDVWTSIGVIAGGRLGLGDGLALAGSHDCAPGCREYRVDRVAPGTSLCRGADGCLVAGFGVEADRGDPCLLSSARIGLPRYTHATGGRPCVHHDARLGSGRMDSATGTRLVGAHRSRPSTSFAGRACDDTPRTQGRSRCARRSGTRSRLNEPAAPAQAPEWFAGRQRFAYIAETPCPTACGIDLRPNATP